MFTVVVQDAVAVQLHGLEAVRHDLLRVFYDPVLKLIDSKLDPGVVLRVSEEITVGKSAVKGEVSTACRKVCAFKVLKTLIELTALAVYLDDAVLYGYFKGLFRPEITPLGGDHNGRELVTAAILRTI